MSNSYSHSLVVGGTGMLFDASLYIAQQSSVTTVIARIPSKLQQLKSDAAQFNSFINTLSLDYTDRDPLISQLELAIEQYGPVELAVLWTHITAPDAPALIGELISQSSMPVVVYHILGSSTAHPEADNRIRQQFFSSLENIEYHEIVLGFVFEGSRSRWLTNDEISEGVIEAIGNHAEKFVVGVVEPWGARP